MREYEGRKPVVIEGNCHPDFEAVEAALRGQLTRSPGGAAVCVYHHGECVVDLWGGARDAEGAAWQADTLSSSFSTTKGVTSTLLHIMAERGLVDYEERVSTYWPGFARAGKKNITVRQVLCHQAGLYHIRRMIDRADRMLDWDYMVRAIEKTQPTHVPGKRTGYHGLTYGFIVGEILQRVTGERFSDLLKSELADPLDLDGLYVGTPDAELHRAATLIHTLPLRRPPLLSPMFYLEQYLTGLNGFLRAAGVDSYIGSFHDALAPHGMRRFDFNDPATQRATMPAANGLFTARSLARVYAMLAGGGELGGTRLISRERLEQISRPVPPTGRYAVIPLNMQWRLGYHGVITNRGFRKSAFGHFGFGGSGAWADPGLNLAVALTTNSGMGTAFGDRRTANVNAAALESALVHQAAWGRRAVSG